MERRNFLKNLGVASAFGVGATASAKLKPKPKPKASVKPSRTEFKIKIPFDGNLDRGNEFVEVLESKHRESVQSVRAKAIRSANGNRHTIDLIKSINFKSTIYHKETWTEIVTKWRDVDFDGQMHSFRGSVTYICFMAYQDELLEVGISGHERKTKLVVGREFENGWKKIQEKKKK